MGERFFDDDVLAKNVNLTKDERASLESFEWDVYVGNGYKHINGGYANLTIYDYDDEEKLLFVEVECGEQDCGSGYSSCHKWIVVFKRKGGILVEADEHETDS